MAHPPASETSCRRTEDRQQVRAVSGVAVADARGLALRAVTGNLGKPIGDLRVPSLLGDQPVEPVAPGTAALVAFDPELLELAESPKVVAPSRGMGCIIIGEGRRGHSRNPDRSPHGTIVASNAINSRRTVATGSMPLIRQ